jgi:hypothetical protein
MGWIKNLKQISTSEQLEEFILLFDILSDIQLNENRDAIQWRWSTSGEYTAATAYEAQFLGAYPLFRASAIWQAKTEPKYRFFAWLVLLGKTLTTDNLQKKWPCELNCPLCYCELETGDNLLTECIFLEAVWDKVAQAFQVHLVVLPFQKGTVQDWLSAITRARARKHHHFLLVVYLKRKKQQSF